MQCSFFFLMKEDLKHLTIGNLFLFGAGSWHISSEANLVFSWCRHRDLCQQRWWNSWMDNQWLRYLSSKAWEWFCLDFKIHMKAERCYTQHFVLFLFPFYSAWSRDVEGFILLIIYYYYFIFFHAKIRKHAWQIGYLDSSDSLLLYNF